MYGNIPDKEKKLLRNKKVSNVVHTADGVTVHCTDGSTYTGDVLAGTDGVHSKIRAEMWRIANEQEPGAIPESEQKLPKATYYTLFGISPPVEGLDPGTFHFRFAKSSVLYATGSGERVFYGVWNKLDKQYEAGEKRFSLKECDEEAAKYAHLPLMPNGALTFGDVYNTSEHRALVATEEGFYPHCTWGRFACLGDSVHKVTPSNGEGANCSITTAAALTNTLKSLVDRSKGRKPTYGEVKSALVNEFQDPRNEKMKGIVKLANEHTRVVTMDNFIIRAIIRYWAPNLGPDGGMPRLHSMEIAPDILNFLPVPERALRGTMGYNKLVGAGTTEATWLRWFLALPFIAAFFVAAGRMDPTNAIGSIIETLQKGNLKWKTGSMPIYDTFFGNKSLDDFLKLVTTFFAPWTLGYDAPGAWQATQFLTDYGVLYSIMLIEAQRRANIFTPMKMPWLFALAAQYLGGGLVMQLFYFFHSALSPLPKFIAKDYRLTDVQYTSTVLPAMLIGYYIPAYLSLAVPIGTGPFEIAGYTIPQVTLETRYWWSYVWQLFPIWAWLAQKVFSFFSKSSIRWDRLYNVQRDLPLIRFSVYSVVAISAATYWYTLTQMPFSLREVFVPLYWDPPKDFLANVANFMKWDYIFVFGGGFYWLALLFNDLKQWEMLRASWLSLILMAAVTVAAAGPGAAAGLAWLWREEMLASGEMKGQLMKEGWKGVEGGEIEDRIGNGAVNGKANGKENGNAKRK